METAYCGPAPLPGIVPWAWNLDPPLLAALALALLLVRHAPPSARWGVAMLAVAYVSPICALSAGLFSARAVHHLILVFAAAPLLAWHMPDLRRLPLTAALGFHIIMFWPWHWPAVYEWALSSHLAYWIGQLALLGSAMLFWRALFRAETSAPSTIFAVAAMVMQMGLLGAIITFAPQAVYTPHFATASLYGLTPIEDQQVAGLIMWVTSLPLTLAAASPILAHWLGRFEKEARA